MTPNEAENPRDALLEAALIEGLSYAAAAELAGASKATATRRMADPAFRQRVLEGRQAAAEEAASVVEGLALRAAAKLGELLDSEQDLAAYRACALILERAEKRQAARDLAGRLARLEEAVEQVLEGQRRGPRAVA